MFLPGKLLPSDFSRTTLIFPNAENMAGFDFIVFDNATNRVYMVQVTITENANSHRFNSMAAITNKDSALTKWIGNLYDATKDKGVTYLDIYITLKESGVNVWHRRLFSYVAVRDG